VENETFEEDNKPLLVRKFETEGTYSKNGNQSKTDVLEETSP
jgi:hypothetical protein